MTTVAWDGQMLAADSRTTRTKSPSDTRNWTCTGCGTIQDKVVSDDTNKLCVGFDKDVKFRDERVFALASAGNARDCEQIEKVFRSKENFEDVWRHCVLARSMPAFAATTLVVTENSVFKLEDEKSKNDLKVTRYEKTDQVAIGSGSKAAMAAMVVFGLDAVGAVLTATQVDDASGGAVHYVTPVEAVSGKEAVGVAGPYQPDALKKLLNERQKKPQQTKPKTRTTR